MYCVLSRTAADPVCSSSIQATEILDGTSVHMQCNVSFNGSIWQRPQMTWYSSGEFVQNRSTVANPNVAVWSIVDFVVEPPIVNYTCVTHFSTPYYSYDQPVKLSQAIPSYKFAWTPPVVPVICESIIASYFEVHRSITDMFGYWPLNHCRVSSG